MDPVSFIKDFKYEDWVEKILLCNISNPTVKALCTFDLEFARKQLRGWAEEERKNTERKKPFVSKISNSPLQDYGNNMVIAQRVPADGYRWKMYSHTKLQNNNTRYYYRCTFIGCESRKYLDKNAQTNEVSTSFTEGHTHPCLIELQHQQIDSQKSVMRVGLKINTFLSGGERLEIFLKNEKDDLKDKKLLTHLESHPLEKTQKEMDLEVGWSTKLDTTNWYLEFQIINNGVILAAIASEYLIHPIVPLEEI